MWSYCFVAEVTFKLGESSWFFLRKTKCIFYANVSIYFVHIFHVILLCLNKKLLCWNNNVEILQEKEPTDVPFDECYLSVLGTFLSMEKIGFFIYSAIFVTADSVSEVSVFIACSCVIIAIKVKFWKIEKRKIH